MKNRKLTIWLSISGCIVLVGVALGFVFLNKRIFLIATTPDIKDGGFLSGEPCSAPCFLGIIPNKTKESQAIKILKDYGLYKNCYIYDNESETGLRGAVCSNTNVSIVYFRGSDLIGSIGFRPTEQLTVEMVIDKYGVPNSVSVASIWVNWERQPTTNMALVYDDINATISLGKQEGNIFEVKPVTIIESIRYSDNTFPSTEEYESGNGFLSAWHGYGDYQDVSDP